MAHLNSALVVGLLALASLIQGTIIEYRFDTRLDGVVSNNGIWHWNYRNRLPYNIPSGNDGFAVMNSNSTGGDTLYDPNVDLQYGLQYFIRFHVAGAFKSATAIKLLKLNSLGNLIGELADWTILSDASNNQWFEMSGTIDPSAGSSRLGIFCSTPSQNPVDGGIMYGCAIDYMRYVSDDPNIGSSPEPTIPPPTSTVATTHVVDTTPSVTASPPRFNVDYDFESGTMKWVLGRSNGAIWQRVPSNYSNVQPIDGQTYCLQVFPVDIYSGTVVAMSPRLVVGPLGEIKLTVDFYLDANWEYPVFLKLRRRLSFASFDDEPAINLDSYGDQYNSQWLRRTDTYSGLTPGEEFNLILEGGLGIKNNDNSISVSRILVDGAAEVEYDEVSFFDFNDGLVGWQSGANDGGKWESLVYNPDDQYFNGIPPPTSGQLLMVDRYDIHSGIITIESPPISVTTGKEVQTRFWINGTLEYPVHFRVGLKTLDGTYDSPPFLDLSEYGNSLSQDWMELEAYKPIPVGSGIEYFQLIIEVDLGANEYNKIAIDSINVSSTTGAQDFNAKPNVLGYVKPKQVEDNTQEMVSVIHDERAENYTAEYDFSVDTQGWSLGRSNGAAWQRVISGYAVHPFEGQSYVLQVFPVDVYSGTVLAMSPRLVVGPSQQIELTVEFYIKASKEYPAFLKLRRRLSFSEFDDLPAMNLDSYGDQYNSKWLRQTRVYGGLTEGEEFNLIMEAGLGADNVDNSVAVSRIVVKGAVAVEYNENTFFDFKDGLVGWQSGSNDGGKWVSLPYMFVNPNLGLPIPASGQVLMVDRYDIHSGIITLESPPIAVSAMSAKQMQIRFWIKGSPVYPVSFRISLKTLDGTYDADPFVDLFEYGNSDSQNWMQLENSVSIPADPKNKYFQLVLEADLGGDAGNQIAIDNIDVITIGPRSGTHSN